MSNLNTFLKPFIQQIMIASGLFLCLAPAVAEESYSGVKVNAPEAWKVGQMQTFSGSIPSRAWVYEQNGAEVLVSAMMTEGVKEGLAQAKPEGARGGDPLSAILAD